MRLLVSCLLLTLLAPAAVAQEPTDIFYIFEMEEVGDPVPHEVPFPGGISIPLVFRDESRDNTGQAEGVPAYPLATHRTRIEVTPLDGEEKAGWTVAASPPTFMTQPGREREFLIVVSVAGTATDPTFAANVTAWTTTDAGVKRTTISVIFLTQGLQGFTATPSGGLEVEPSQVASTAVTLKHPGLLKRSFGFEIVRNPCGLSVVPPAATSLEPRSEATVAFDIRGPTDRLWYFTEDCSLSLRVFDLANPDSDKTVPISVVVNGGYLNPAWIFWAIGLAVAAVLLIAFLRRRTQVIEEELLGKPQRPWTIPVERVYLEHLEAKDPRAAYVVRHFLMEEEYASALLWYKYYKQGTRGERSKEALVVRQEKKYDRFKRGWEKQIAAPMKQADKFEAKLQKKLDRKAKGHVRKDRRAWKKTVAKLEKAVEAQNAKSLAKWEKAAAKAEKKGNTVPPKPELESPDLPPKPQLQKIHLADHKWNKKAVKFRKKMVKREGNLEVKFEKKDARMLHKLRKKVHKIARKLDDPTFVEEHPLLAGEA